MLSDSRSMVATSRMVGKAENSSGFSIHSDTIRISTDSAIEKASPMSIMKAGIGRKKMQRMPTMIRGEGDVPPALVRGWRARWRLLASCLILVDFARSGSGNRIAWEHGRCVEDGGASLPQTAARLAHILRGACEDARPQARMRCSVALISLFDAAVDLLGEGMDLRADEASR